MMNEHNIRSMTGYGRGMSEAGGIRLVAEIRSVNHRFLEWAIRLPSGWASLEDRVKKTVASVVRRGRIDVTVLLEGKEVAEKKLTVNWEAARSLADAAGRLQEQLGVEGTFSLSDLLHHPEVIQVEETKLDPEEWEAPLIQAVEEATHALLEMRQREGAALAEDLSNRIKLLRGYVKGMAQRSPHVVAEYRSRLEEKIRDVLDGTDPDPDRLLTEAAVFADKSDIQEELTRMSSHLDQFSSALTRQEPVGRRLDFLIQEMNREINTIGSKANDARIAELVVDCKSELEKMREQVQNIE